MTRDADEVSPNPAVPAPAEVYPLDSAGRERPHFLLQFPEDPRLGELVRAFERGDYAAVRLGAPTLMEEATEPAVRLAARDLRRRIDPDPLMKYLLWSALGLFVFLVFYTYQSHSH